MGLRLCVALLIIGLTRTADADMIQLVTNGTFDSDLTGWAPTTTNAAGGNWVWEDDDVIVNLDEPGVALLVTDQTDPFETGTMRLTQTFAPFTDDPLQTVSGTLAWEQYMTSAIEVWSNSHRFSVLLEDQTGTTSTVFTRNSGSGPFGPENQSFSVLAFLQQLTAGESFSLVFEAATAGSMHVEIDNVSLLVDAPAATPEPGSFLLCSLAGAGYFANRRRRRKRALAAE